MQVIEIQKQAFKQMDIVDEKDRLVSGYASVEIVDMQGDIVPVDELRKAMIKFMDRGGYIIYGHENKPVGKVLQWEIRKHEETGVNSIWILAKIYNDYEIDDKVWDMIKGGELKGFSIGAEAKQEKAIVKDSEGKEHHVNILRDLKLVEISVVKQPANPLATIREVNYYAKSLDAGEVKKYIRRRDGKWIIEDSTGKKKEFISYEDVVNELKESKISKKELEIIDEKGIDTLDVDALVEYFENDYGFRKYIDVFKENVSEIVKDDSVVEDLVSEFVRTVSLIVAGEDRSDYPIIKDSEFETEKVESEKSEKPKVKVKSKPEKHKVDDVAEAVDEGTKQLKEIIDKCKELLNVIKKDDCKNRYVDENGRFKVMTCPDDASEESRFCGCVRYFMNCRNLSLDSAKKMCGYIRRYVKRGYTDKEAFEIVEKVLDNFKGDVEKTVKYLSEEVEFITKPNDKRPPKEWWDRCIRRVRESGAGDPERLCGYVFYHVLGGSRARANASLRKKDMSLVDAIIRLKKKKILG